MSKQIKLKSLLKEGFAWERKPGKPLPTIQEVMDEFQASQKAEIPPVPVKEGENISSKYWVIGKDKRGDLYVFNDGYYNTKEEAEAAFKNIIVPKIVDANTIKVEPVPSSPNYTALYNNLSESSLEEEILKENPEHLLKNQYARELNKIIFNLYDSGKIQDEEYEKMQSLLKMLDS